MVYLLSTAFASLCLTFAKFMSRFCQFIFVTQPCQTLHDPMECGTPGVPVHHQLQDVTQTHVHWVSDTIQQSHPLSSPSPPVFNLSQNEGLFQGVNSSHQVAKVLEFQLQHQSIQWIFRTDFFRMDCLELLAVHRTLKSLLDHYSSKTSILQCSAFFIVHSHTHTWPLEKPKLWLDAPLLTK